MTLHKRSVVKSVNCSGMYRLIGQLSNGKRFSRSAVNRPEFWCPVRDSEEKKTYTFSKYTSNYRSLLRKLATYVGTLWILFKDLVFIFMTTRVEKTFKEQLHIRFHQNTCFFFWKYLCFLQQSIQFTRLCPIRIKY